MHEKRQWHRLHNLKHILHTKQCVEKKNLISRLKSHSRIVSKRISPFIYSLMKLPTWWYFTFLCGIKICPLKRGALIYSMIVWQLYCSLWFCIPLSQCYWNYGTNAGFVLAQLQRRQGTEQLGKVLVYVQITFLERVSRKMHGEMGKIVLSHISFPPPSPFCCCLLVCFCILFKQLWGFYGSV